MYEDSHKIPRVLQNNVQHTSKRSILGCKFALCLAPPARPGARGAQQYIRAAVRPEPGARNSNAWRCAQENIRGREAAGHEREPRPPGSLLRAGCGRGGLRTVRSPPPVRPHGAPQSEERKSAKRASHAVQAAMSSCTALRSVEPWWPSRPGPAGARCATLTGLASGRFAKAGAVLEQWDTTALFRRVRRRATRAVKPGGSNVKECDRADRSCFEMRINRESRPENPQVGEVDTRQALPAEANRPM